MRARFLATVTAASLVALASVGCAAPEASTGEEVSESADELGTACVVAQAVSIGASRVAVRAWVATGACAAGTLVVTAGSGTPVCVAPAVGATAASLVSVFASGIAFLTCAQLEMSDEEIRLDERATRPALTCHGYELAELEAKERAACDHLDGSCSQGDLMRHPQQLCLAIMARRHEIDGCQKVRQEVNDRCFGGANHPEHERKSGDTDQKKKVCTDAFAEARCSTTLST